MHSLRSTVQAIALLALTAPAYAHGFLEVPAMYPTVQAAIDAAHDGDVVWVFPGVYPEAAGVHAATGGTAGLIIDGKTGIIIVGFGPGQTIIDLGDTTHGLLLAGAASGCSLQGIALESEGDHVITTLDTASGLSMTDIILDLGPGGVSALAAGAGGERIFSSTIAGAGDGTAIGGSASGVEVTGSILWQFSGLADVPSGVTITWCGLFAIGGALPSGGSITVADPQFADPVAGDYHLKSTRGRFVGPGFVADSTSSPFIDAADPMASPLAELTPSGGRANLGAFAGTGEASLSPFECAATFCGDCDRDGVVSITDSLRAAQIGIGLSSRPPAGSYEFDACNTAGPITPSSLAQIDILDALALARQVAGLVTVTCCQAP